MILIVELMYVLFLLLVFLFLFRSMLRSRWFNRVVEEPLAPPESDEAVLLRFENTREDVADSIQTSERHAQLSTHRALRMRDAVTKPILE